MASPELAESRSPFSVHTQHVPRSRGFVGGTMRVGVWPGLGSRSGWGQVPRPLQQWWPGLSS